MSAKYLLKQSTKKVILLILIIPMIIDLVLINLVPLVTEEWLYYFLFFTFWLLWLPYFYWLNTVVKFLYENSNENFKIKLINFKICLLISMIVILNFVFFIAYIFSFVFKGGEPNVDMIFFMVFIQFVGVACFIYNSYFICKLIATIELKRKVYFIDIASNFMIFSIPPVAVGIIQSKVKKIQSTLHSLEKRMK